MLERLGIGPNILRKYNSRLILGRMTGWGQDGIRSQNAGHDINYLASTGHLAAIADKDGHPAIPLNLLGDYAGRSMFLIAGVLADVCAERICDIQSVLV